MTPGDSRPHSPPGQPAGILTRIPGDVWPRLLLAVPLIVMILVTGLNFRLIGDELANILIIESYTSSWPRFATNEGYNLTSPPLPLVLWTLYAKVVGLEVWKLRLLPVLVTYLTANLFYSLGKQRDLPYPLLSAFLLLFFPYVFAHAFTVYTPIFGLLFGVWALHYYLKDDPSPGQLLKGSLLATLAVFSRQSYLILPVGMLLHELFRGHWRSLAPWIRKRYRHWLALSLPFVAMAVLFLLWGGFTPPSQHVDKRLFFLGQRPNFMALFAGFYFLPMLSSRRTLDLAKARRVALIAVALLIPLFFLFTPVYDERAQHYAVTGLIMHGLDVVGNQIAPPVGVAAMFALWLVGVLVILGEVADLPWSAYRGRLLVMLAVFLVLISFIPRTTERYLLPIVPLLMLLLHKPFRRRTILLLWLLFQGALAAAFAYWQIALKSFEIW